MLINAHCFEYVIPHHNHIQTHSKPQTTYKYIITIYICGYYTAAAALPPLPGFAVAATTDCLAGLPFSFLSSCAICCCLHSELQKAVSPLYI